MRVLGIGLIVWMLLMGNARAAQNEVFLIESFEDLERLSRAVAEGEGAYEGKAYLMNDIEAVRPFTPIGDAEHMFAGVFDGQGYAVRNLRISDAGDYSGLFGCIGREGVVRNLTVRDALVTGQRYTGAVAGYSAGHIERCTVENGRIIGLSENEFSIASGGIVGLTNGTVEQCVNLNAEVYAKRYVGGIAGSLCAGTIERCLSTGEIFSMDDGEALAGGVVGAVQSSGEVRECISLSEVRAEKAFSVGGIAGGVLSGRVVKCIYLGTAYGREPGAIAGFADRRAQLMGCLYDAACRTGTGEGRTDGTLPMRRGIIRWDEERMLTLIGK